MIRLDHFALLLGFAVGFCCLAAAGPLPVAQCQSSTLDTYLANGFACAIYNVTFSGFSYIENGITDPGPTPANSVFVTPLFSTTHPGFVLNGPWEAGKDSHTFEIDYDAQTISGRLVGHEESMSVGRTPDLATILGLDTSDQKACPGVVYSVNCRNPSVIALDTSVPRLSDSKTLATPQKLVGLGVYSFALGSETDTASIGTISTTVSYVPAPEPGSGIALVAALMIFGRRIATNR